jgi:hypothetical protein
MGVLENAQVADERWRKRVDETLDDHRDQLSGFEEKFTRGNTRFEEGERRMTAIELKLDQNNKMTETINTNTSGIVTWTKNVSGFNNVVKYVGDLLLKVAAVIIAAGVVNYFMKSGEAPAPKIPTVHHQAPQPEER